VYPGQRGPGGHPQNWQGYPAPPGAGQFGAPPVEPTRRRSRRIVLSLVIGLVGVAVAIVAVGVLRGGGSPRETAEEFLSALKAKDVDKAHDLLCADGRRRVSVAELRNDFELTDHTITSYVITNDSKTRQRDNHEETLVEATLTYETGAAVPVQIGVWSGSGQKICSLQPPPPQ